MYKILFNTRFFRSDIQLKGRCLSGLVMQLDLISIDQWYIWHYTGIWMKAKHSDREIFINYSIQTHLLLSFFKTWPQTDLNCLHDIV